MLENDLDLKNAIKQNSTIENRVKRLKEEEERIEKNNRMAEKKAGEMLKNRSRHYEDMMNKI